MKLLYFILFAILISVVGCNNIDDKGLSGSWEIIEFKIFQGGKQVMSSSTKDLKDNSAVWDMNFSKNGKFSQDFNMRDPQMKMETENGNWNFSGDTIKIELFSDTLTTHMNYIYKINADTLNLSLTHPVSKSQVITVFTKK